MQVKRQRGGGDKTAPDSSAQHGSQAGCTRPGELVQLSVQAWRGCRSWRGRILGERRLKLSLCEEEGELKEGRQ